MALPEGHHHVLQRDKFASAGQMAARQVDRKRRQDLDLRPGRFQRLGARAEQAAGELAFTRGAVLGALLLAVHEHLVLDALGAPSAAGLVAARLLFPRLLQRALGIAQGVRGAVEIVGGAGASSLAGLSKGRPPTAEYADAD